ncbi:MAG: aspartate/glutamate racemase family protein [Planctomycetota bacterium]
MAAHVGIVACSAEGAALCYRTICLEASRQMGEHNHPEITMHTHPLSEYMIHIRSGNWPAVAELMLSSAHNVAQAGAEFAICPDNTIHQAFEMVIDKSPIPWLHIARTVAEEAKSRGFNRLGILGTKYLMTGPVYPQALRDCDISYEIPEANVRERIDEIIFTELVNGLFLEESRLYFYQIIERFQNRGCNAVVLGCTEIPLIIEPNSSCLPTLDSTRLLARAALRKALQQT